MKDEFYKVAFHALQPGSGGVVILDMVFLREALMPTHILSANLHFRSA